MTAGEDVQGAGNALDASLPTVPPPSDEFLLAWAEGFVAGYERGREAAVDEINAAYPPEKIFSFGTWYSQAEERQKHDAETRRLVALERGE